MRKTMSLKQIAANRLNARKSTGPKTPEGRAVSKMNALKHGILSKEAVVHGRCIKESDREFAALHQRLWDELQPAGPLEEMLVDQIVTAHWRLRRALKAESGEIALSVDEGQWKRRSHDPRITSLLWEMRGNPAYSMRNSALGNLLLENQLKAVRASVEKEGELTEAAIQSVIFRGKPYGLTEDLEELRAQLQQNPEGLESLAMRAKQKEQALNYINSKLGFICWEKTVCEEREKKEEEARQAAAVLPSLEVLDKILRYETKLERQLFRAMAQLERLQRMRRGESVPAPLSVELSERV
jgi:hypothetical protein